MHDSAGSSFSAHDVAPRLVEEFGYRPAAAERVAQRLTSIDPVIRDAFWQWWQTGSLDPALEVEGYTVDRLMSEYGLNPVAAFSTLDGLKNAPQLTLDTLRRGFDRRSPPVKIPPSK
jgi:hypothetical protein